MDADRPFAPIADAERHYWGSKAASRADADPSDAFPQTSPPKQSPIQDITSQSDPDTCRICRGEGSAEEPLFYPCKCSGSIKYVHQDCLMEWLSHSQKKHCELCKTPFRFTKLYSPNMPKTVPFYVFVSHMTKYVFRNMLVWARGGLVLMVWLVWLPYLMRRVWSALFWLSDEGLGPIFGRPDTASTVTANTALAFGTTTCPSSPLFAQTTTAATLQGVMGQMPLGSNSQTTTSLYGINITTDNPLSNILLNMFLGTFYIGGTASRSNASVAVQNVVAPTPTHQPTLLSEVRFLQKLSSSSPALGNFAIDVLEGQIITVVVIICFILIILVRDYVVQQQPDINMRAAFAAAENAIPPENAEQAPPPVAVPIDPREGLAVDGAGLVIRPETDDDGLSVQAVNGDVEEQDIHWTSSLDEAFELNNDLRQQRVFSEMDGRPDSPTTDFSQRDSPGRALLYDRDRAGVRHEFGTARREVEGDPRHAREVVRKTDLEKQVEHYVKMRGQTPAFGEGEPSSRRDEWRPTSDWPSDEDLQEEAQHPQKGKSPMRHELLDIGDQNHTSRPRSATDGPQRVGGINPLGHNNWSFSDAPFEPHHANPQIPSSSGSGPVIDTAGSGSQHWTYITPPSSTLAESASSSMHGRTPSSSGSDEVAGISAAVAQEEARVITSQARHASEWEEMTDLNQQLETQDGTDALVEEDVAREQPQPAGLAQRLADFMWRDVEAIPPHELPPLPEAGDDFFDHEQDAAVAIVEDPLQQPQERDQEVIAAAAAAGIDAEAEAIEDAEDLEGILELLGMRGPIAGLFQNALFCAFLVSITLFLGVFFPYNLGRTSIWLVANPTRPIRILFSVSKFVQDTALLLMGFVSTVLLSSFDSIFSLVRPGASQLDPVRNMVQGSWNMTENAADRLIDSFMTDLPFISTDEVRNFSIVSHAALLMIKSQVALVLAVIGKAVLFVFGGDYITKALSVISWVTTATCTIWQGVKNVPGLISIPGSWVIDLGTSEPAAPLNFELASWSAMDRVWAILGGYTTMCVVAALYLGRGGPITPGRVGQEWEATIIDALVQASGVMKVILIIGIEMLVFPLYCGLLLDIALLPLFEDTTVMSRVMFTVNYPLTSIFVHWFVGTGYMFHFALFVSMCRKIMRKGVLYFIRDPDDAEFHPVRDVLERNVTTQLRKILFSAFVYGALVIVCLGGVVWALSYGLNVLPIYYSSNEPVLEFPIDLLFYNFLMPLAVKFFKPSDGLHTMYTWWFQKLARSLRLTWFLFGERKVDEEGTLQLKPTSSARQLPWWQRVFLEVDGREVIPKSWKDTFEVHAKPVSPISQDRLSHLDENKAHLVKSGQLIPDGRFVRAPASDQVKIPKGERVFFDVSEHNERQDGKPDRPGTDFYSTNSYQFVYVPPNFRLRIFLFILFIWIFAAVTGLGFTIIPLIFGRWMFRLFIPADIRTNDIYAFSIGVYILGSVVYFAYRIRGTYDKARDWAGDIASHILDSENFTRAASIVMRTAKLIYTYSFLLIIFPFMVSSILELYIMIPLDTYMYGNDVSDPNANPAALPRHTVKVMQSWTIGVIYLKLGARFVVHWHRDSRVAAATRAVLRHGWLEPDVKVLTRAFIVPGIALWFLAVFGPLMLAKAAIWYIAGPIADDPHDPATVLVYRFCFFAALLCAMVLGVTRGIFRVFRSWRVRIKDEAYLIGERLHNFSLPPQALHEREKERRRTRVGWD